MMPPSTGPMRCVWFSGTRNSSVPQLAPVSPLLQGHPPSLCCPCSPTELASASPLWSLPLPSRPPYRLPRAIRVVFYLAPSCPISLLSLPSFLLLFPGLLSVAPWPTEDGSKARDKAAAKPHVYFLSFDCLFRCLPGESSGGSPSLPCDSSCLASALLQALCSLIRNLLTVTWLRTISLRLLILLSPLHFAPSSLPLPSGSAHPST